LPGQVQFKTPKKLGAEPMAEQTSQVMLDHPDLCWSTAFFKTQPPLLIDTGFKKKILYVFKAVSRHFEIQM
jgi:hypothetical protein